MLRAEARGRWIAARWALRGVLGRYLRQDPAGIELRTGSLGKPMLAEKGESLRFNLSHSGDLALVAIARGREVGVDVERIGARTAGFYADWTRREATAKCFGTGLGAPLPDDPVILLDLDAPPGFAAAVAVSGDAAPALRRFTIAPSDIAP
jgi:4'-phosphopantetheinyl transferase